MKALSAGLALAAGVTMAGLPLDAVHAQAPSLSVPFTGNQGSEVGTVTLRGGDDGTVLRVQINPGYLTPGWHGIHFHAVGDCSDPAKFEASKAHVNHHQDKHGLLNPEGPDDGDLPNIYAAADGSVNAELYIEEELSDFRDRDGSALVIHANEDDHMSQPIGNAGARVACAAIR